MRDEGRRTRDERQGARKEDSSVVPANEVSGRPSSVGFKGIRLSSIAVVLLALLVSCGYHFTPVGGIVPEGAKTIAIPVFINETVEPYIDLEVTKAVVEEFLTDGRLKVVSIEAADVVLKGRVTRYEVTPASYTADSYVQSYNVSIGVSLTFEDARTKKVLLQDQGLGTVFISGYAVTIGDISATKIAKDAAIKNASKNLAATVRSRVLEGF